MTAKLFLVALVAAPIVFTVGLNEFKINADEYFTAVTSTIQGDLRTHDQGKTHLLNNYSIKIGGSPFTLKLNNGTINKLSNISHSAAVEAVYTIPAVGALYTIGNAVLQFKFFLESDLSSVESSEGDVTLDVSGVGISVAIAAYETNGTSNKYATQEVKNKLAVLGTLKNVELSSHPYVNMKDFVELWYNRDSHNIGTEIHRGFYQYFGDAIKKVDVSKYVKS